MSLRGALWDPLLRPVAVWKSSGECRWAALIVFKDGAEGMTEKRRGGKGNGRRLPVRHLEGVKQKGQVKSQERGWVR